MLSDEDLKLILSSDPDGMFGGLILILDNKLTNLQGAAWTFAARKYVQTVYAFLDSHELDIKVDRDVPEPDSSFINWFPRFRVSVEYFTAAHRFRLMREDSGQIFNLNERRRKEIHVLLNKIRIVVDGMDILPEKRDAIVKRIAKLQAEVDKSKTNMREVVDVIATLAASGKPLDKYAERLLRAYAGASVENQRPAIAAPLKRISGPSANLVDMSTSDGADTK